MSKDSKVHQLLADVKKILFGSEQKFTDYKLSDGSEIKIDKLEPGGKATIAGIDAAPGEYKLEDGTLIMVGDEGMISAITPKTEDAAAPGDMSTPDGMRKAYDKFAVGTPEERVTNLETLLRSMAEYFFAWQEQQMQEQSSLSIAATGAQEQATAANVQATAQTTLMKQMFALVETMAGAPIENAPDNKKKKFSFSNAETKNKSLEKYQEAAKKIRDGMDEQMKVA